MWIQGISFKIYYSKAVKIVNTKQMHGALGCLLLWVISELLSANKWLANQGKTPVIKINAQKTEAMVSIIQVDIKQNLWNLNYFVFLKKSKFILKIKDFFLA